MPSRDSYLSYSPSKLTTLHIFSRRRLPILFVWRPEESSRDYGTAKVVPHQMAVSISWGAAKPPPCDRACSAAVVMISPPTRGSSVPASEPRTSDEAIAKRPLEPIETSAQPTLCLVVAISSPNPKGNSISFAGWTRVSY